ncbi:MAG TPA: hypothetical protein VFM76_08210 [Methylophaga sp.]|nr:hypothetical protein [Methylophaga sp.]
MTTYHRLLLITALSSGFLTFCLLQAGGINSAANQENPSQQLQSSPLPYVTEYYALGQPGLMTLALQYCVEKVCQPKLAANSKITSHQQSEIGI